MSLTVDFFFDCFFFLFCLFVCFLFFFLCACRRSVRFCFCFFSIFFVNEEMK